ncbi:MAG: hypothetical protein J0H82_04445 [Alphaproteobacteria bacterium]|jgi:hypothetical protein|nr:hypothetical protein [Alphaproteobacteria bacterium]
MTTIVARLAAALESRLGPASPMTLVGLAQASGYGESTVRRLRHAETTHIHVAMLVALDQACVRFGLPGLMAEVLGGDVSLPVVAAGDLAMWFSERGEALHAPQGLRALAAAQLGLGRVEGDAAGYARRMLGWVGATLREDGTLLVEVERGAVEGAALARLREHAARHGQRVRRVVITLHQGDAAVSRDYARLGEALEALDRAAVMRPVVGQHLLVSAAEVPLSFDRLDAERRFLLDLPLDVHPGEVLAAASRCGMLDRTAMVRVGDDGSVRLLYAGDGVRIRADAVGREAGEMDDLVYGEALRRDMRRACAAGRSFTRVDLAAADAAARYTRSAIRAAGGVVVTTNLVDRAPPGSRVG